MHGGLGDLLRDLADRVRLVEEEEAHFTKQPGTANAVLRAGNHEPSAVKLLVDASRAGASGLAAFRADAEERKAHLTGLLLAAEMEMDEDKCPDGGALRQPEGKRRGRELHDLQWSP